MQWNKQLPSYAGIDHPTLFEKIAQQKKATF
jgi:hypothetical protein